MKLKYYSVIFAILIIVFLMKSKKQTEHFGSDYFHRAGLKDRVHQYDLLQNRSFLYPNHCKFWKCKESCANNQWICKSHEHRFNPKNIV